MSSRLQPTFICVRGAGNATPSVALAWNLLSEAGEGWMWDGRWLMTQDACVLRDFLDSDRRDINLLSCSEGMGELHDFEHVIVAVASNEEVVGLIMLHVRTGIYYVNPIIVLPVWRRLHVGKALIELARGRYGELRFVSRGSSVPFYAHLGAVPMPWEMIDASISRDCVTCSRIDSCNPLPMGFPPMG